MSQRDKLNRDFRSMVWLFQINEEDIPQVLDLVQISILHTLFDLVFRLPRCGRFNFIKMKLKPNLPRCGKSIFKSPNARAINIFFNSTDSLDYNRSCLVKRRILIVEVFDVFISVISFMLESQLRSNFISTNFYDKCVSLKRYHL